MKRIILFLATNIAVLAVMTVVLSLLGVNRFLTGTGLNLPMLLVFSLVVGFTGSIISLLMSKPMAKWSTGARVIDAPSSSDRTVAGRYRRQAGQRAGIAMPEVAVYEGEPNAFATGAFKNSALVAVSTGLLESMTKDEVEAVLGHEIAHVANGDMVTMTLIQGVVNTFVVFLSRVVGYVVDRALSRGDNNEGPGIGYMVTVLVCANRVRHRRLDHRGLVFAPARIPRRRRLGQAAWLRRSRWSRRWRAWAVSRLPSMPQSLATLGINDRPGFMSLFSTHPPIEERIAALQRGR